MAALTSAVRGNASISESFVKKVAEFSMAGLRVTDAPMGDVAASGAVVDPGKSLR
jgi:hypothetical protein